MTSTNGRVRRAAPFLGALLLAAATGCSGYALPATNVTQSTATLNASVSCQGTAGQNPPSGSPCAAWFKYWPEGQPGQAQTTTPTAPVTSAVSDWKISANVTGLTANTSYEYQVCGYGDQNVPPPGSCGGVKGNAGVTERFRTGVSPAQDWEDKWSGYMIFGSPNEQLPGGRHWTAGDNGNSVQLPDGRRVWVFADPNFDLLDANGQRQCTASAGGRNAFVMEQAAGTLGPTLAGSNPVNVGSLIPEPPPDALVNEDSFYAPQGMTIETNASGNEELRLLVIRAVPLFTAKRIGVARFSLTAGQNPQLIGVTDIGPADKGIIWGSGILDWVDGHTYIYGWTTQPGGPPYKQRSYVARAPLDNILGTWEYWDGSGWSANRADAATLTDSSGQTIPVQSAATPIYRAGRFVILTVNGDSWLKGQADPANAPRGMIQAWTSSTPQGPWTGPTNVYAPPEAQEHDDAFIYNVAVHPHIGGNDPLLLSYNANYGCPPGAQAGDRNRYRPHFIRVSAP